MDHEKARTIVAQAFPDLKVTTSTYRQRVGFLLWEQGNPLPTWYGYVKTDLLGTGKAAEYLDEMIGLVRVDIERTMKHRAKVKR